MFCDEFSKLARDGDKVCVYKNEWTFNENEMEILSSSG